MEFLTCILSIVSTLITGTLSFFITLSIKKAKKKKDEKEHLLQVHTENQMEIRHLTGRVIFWIINGIKKADPTKEKWDDNLYDSFNDYENAEKVIKQTERDIVIKYTKETS